MHRADAPAAAFLDRDGVINYDAGYVHDWSAFRFLPGAVDALLELQKLGYLLIVVTNQSGIARGLYSEEAYDELTHQMREALKDQGVSLSAVYYCPHHPNGKTVPFNRDCDCRKPRTGMIEQALRDFDINLQASILVGDKPSDIEAGAAAGIARRFIVRCNGEDELQSSPKAIAGFDDLAQCVAHLRTDTS
jgi:D-glycero-D-manno-heptose 1,7-bisphosphate phosphatase